MNFCIFYEFGIGRSCRRRSPYVLREPDCGAFAVCKVKRLAVICGGLQGDIGMYGAFFNRLTACCFHSSGPVAGGIFYSRDRISSSVELPVLRPLPRPVFRCGCASIVFLPSPSPGRRRRRSRPATNACAPCSNSGCPPRSAPGIARGDGP